MSEIDRLPELAPTTDGRGATIYRFTSRSDFNYDEWVPTLVDISRAQTFVEQREALRVGIVKVAASSDGLRQIAGSRIRSTKGGTEARFKLDSDDQPILSFLSTGRTAIGYQSPDEECPSPAFAVIDGVNGSEYDVHEVVRDPLQLLSDEADEIGLRTIYSLAGVLNSRYPGFEIMPKLEAGLASSV